LPRFEERGEDDRGHRQRRQDAVGDDAALEVDERDWHEGDDQRHGKPAGAIGVTREDDAGDQHSGQRPWKNHAHQVTASSHATP